MPSFSNLGLIRSGPDALLMSRDIIALSTSVCEIFMLSKVLYSGGTKGGSVALESFMVDCRIKKSFKTSVLSWSDSISPFSVSKIGIVYCAESYFKNFEAVLNHDLLDDGRRCRSKANLS